MLMNTDHIIKKFLNVTVDHNNADRLKIDNLILNNLKKINLKRALLFIKNKNNISNKKSQNFNVIFNNFLMYCTSSANALLSDHQIKKKLVLIIR